MKKFTLKISILLLTVLTGFYTTKAQQTFTINASAPWVGYMNVFDMSNNYQWGSFWGVPALKTIVNTGANSVTFQPNFNTYADAIASGNPVDIAYWTNGAGGGNKIMDALSFIEPSGLAGQTITFTGYVTSNTLNAAYTRVAFIKFLDPNIGYAQTFYTDAPIGAMGTSFSISAAVPVSPANLVVQYGVSIRGVNANPANEAALGSLVLSPVFALGLDLKSFEFTAKQNIANLNWETLNEVNVKSFEVEKSYDALNFSTVGKVSAKNISTARYSFMDEMNASTAHYRLKMVDLDGKYTYSQVVKVYNSNEGSVSIYPNPTSGTLNIKISNLQSASSLTILNTFGQPVLSTSISQYSTNLDISSLAVGNYFVRFNNGDIIKFVKK
jgi:hypothetical protein